MNEIKKLLTAALYRIGMADLMVKVRGEIQKAVLQAASIARTNAQNVYMTQAAYDALPETEEEMQPGDVYYKMDETKAFFIEEEEVQS